jgi:hypothetical protein
MLVEIGLELGRVSESNSWVLMLYSGQKHGLWESI